VENGSCRRENQRMITTGTFGSRPHAWPRWLSVCVFLALPTFLLAAEEPVTPRQPRPVWHNTRLVGTPEPRLPYRTEKTFTDIPLKQPLFAVQQPGTMWLYVVEQAGRVV